MDLRSALAAEHSKAQTLRIAAHVGRSRARLKEMVGFVCGEDPALAPRAAWVVNCCADAQPDLVAPFLPQLLENLRRPASELAKLHDGLKRNTMKTVAELPLPEDLEGLAAAIAFDLLESPSEAVATKVHALSILLRLCEREPALAPEVRLHLAHQLPGAQPALRSRARKAIQTLDRLESGAF